MRVLVVVLLVALTARADWAQLVGKPTPELDAKGWIRPAEGFSPESLKGYAVLVVFWNCANGEALVPTLNELRDRHLRSGLRILAITADGKTKVAEFDKNSSARYPVGPNGKFGAYGSGPAPYAYLINPSGNVVWQGEPKNVPKKEMAAALRKMKLFVLEPPHSLLEKGTKLYLKGKLSEAAGRALATHEWAKGYFNKKTAKGKAQIEGINYGASLIAHRVEMRRYCWWQLAEEGKKSGDYRQVLYALELLTKHFAEDYWEAKKFKLSTGDGPRAKEMLKQLKKQKDVKRELKAAKQIDALVKQHLTRKWTANTKEYLVKRYEAFVARQEGTYSAARANRLLDAVRAMDAPE